MTETNARVVKLTERAAQSALKSQKAAEDTSRSTRVNVQVPVNFQQVSLLCLHRKASHDDNCSSHRLDLLLLRPGHICV
jgi:hypothetical protein